ncbi:hypothetical protein AZE42_11799 [Rhizopogon vesiculosus]|uniref:HAT C-terminal dimerisation domain-containing protein n=1 Tax=Rhizopogon vesiculosus TaxID=180088 RepID=A0A1J8PQ24_9AGAM|nr:hypothetical protein AZE42_11799 [Rhizopogon vesiculosus]
MHILFIVPNSAATERIFSQFGVIHTKLRNRLHLEKVRKQALVKSNTIAQHGSLRQRKRKRKRKRKFFFADSDDESDPIITLHIGTLRQQFVRVFIRPALT